MAKTFLLIISLALYSINGFADMLDSLYAKAVKGNEVNVAAANQLMTTLDSQGCCDSLYVFNENSNKNQVKMILSLYLAYSRYDNGRYLESAKLSYVASRSARKMKDMEFLSDALSHLATTYFRLGSLEEAFKTSVEEQKIDSVLNDPYRLSSVYNNLAAFSLADNQVHEAEVFIKKAITYALKVGDKSRLAIRYGTASEIYTKLHKFDLALDYVTKAYNIEKEMGNKNGLARRMAQMAEVYAVKREYSTALKTYTSSTEMLKEMGDMASLAINYKNMGHIYLDMKDTSSAIEMLTKAEGVCRKTENKYILQQVCDMLAEAYKESNSKLSYQYLKEATALKDSIKGGQSMISAKQLVAEMDRMEQEERMQEHEETISMLKTAIVALLILIAVIIVCGYILHRKRSKSRKEASLLMQQVIADTTADSTADITDIIADSAAVSESSDDGEPAAAPTKPAVATNMKKADREFMLKISKYIASNIGKQKIDIKTMAEYMCMSRSAFIRHVTKVTGTSPNEFVVRMKMEKAVRLLKDTEKSIGDIALACGYDDPSYFIRVFNKHFNTTPQNFRNLPKS